MSAEAPQNSSDRRTSQREVSVNEAQRAVYPERPEIPEPNRKKTMLKFGAIGGGVLLLGGLGGVAAERIANNNDTQTNRTDTDGQNNENPDNNSGELQLGENPASPEVPTGSEPSIDVTPSTPEDGNSASPELNAYGFPAGFVNPETGEIDHAVASSLRLEKYGANGEMLSPDQMVDQVATLLETMIHIGVPASTSTEIDVSVPTEEKNNQAIIESVFRGETSDLLLPVTQNFVPNGSEWVTGLSYDVLSRAYATASDNSSNPFNEPQYHMSVDAQVLGADLEGKGTLDYSGGALTIPVELSFTDNMDQKPQAADHAYMNNLFGYEDKFEASQNVLMYISKNAQDDDEFLVRIVPGELKDGEVVVDENPLVIREEAKK